MARDTIHTRTYHIKNTMKDVKEGVLHFKKTTHSAGRRAVLLYLLPHFFSVGTICVMPPKHQAPAKLTAAQLAELGVIDLCSSSSEDEVEVADPHATLEPLVEPPCLQPAHYADQEAGMGPQGAGIAFAFNLYSLCRAYYCTSVLVDPAMLAPLPPASTCVDEDAEHAMAGVNRLWCVDIVLQ